MSEILAVIPARGGSKGVPHKNRRLIAGKPLIAWTVEAAVAATLVNRVVVSTDDDEIAKLSKASGAEVIMRPASISGDMATSESALLHALDALREQEHYDPDILVFLQCTSPLRSETDIDRAIEALVAANADSLLSVVQTTKFFWRLNGDQAESVNYDFMQRPRHQDLEPLYLENGSIYVLKPDILRTHNNRLGGKIMTFPMPQCSAIDIDTAEDFELAEQALRGSNSENVS
ncbi:MAG: acylneuraminate cytidylyltransferase family protein [Lentisphaerae bacterium]|nr:acylneuraminate cytidylyltransferase family protein [Lentisphaerota bacterium]